MSSSFFLSFWIRTIISGKLSIGKGDSNLSDGCDYCDLLHAPVLPLTSPLRYQQMLIFLSMPHTLFQFCATPLAVALSWRWGVVAWNLQLVQELVLPVLDVVLMNPLEATRLYVVRNVTAQKYVINASIYAVFKIF